MKRGLLVLLAVLAGGCAIHPGGEEEERARAEAAGAPYGRPFEERVLPDLPPDASIEDLVRHALLANAELEAKFFEWRAALERIPQAASPPGTAMLGFSEMFDGGGTSAWDRTTLALQTDPMANLPFPTKLAAAGRAALEEARAAGLRFDRARYALQAEVVRADVELAHHHEIARIRREELALLDLVEATAEARTRSGSAPQQDWLKARTELDLARNDLLVLDSEEPGLRARLNALLGLPPDASVTARFPEPRGFSVPDVEVLARVAERNPELQALAREVAGRREALALARKAYLPDFSFSGSITGSVVRTVGAALTLPLLRREAIEAGIAEADANLRAAEAARREAANDLAARAVLELYALRNAERQANLFESAILPRAEALVDLSRAAYAAGRVGIVDLLDSRRTALEARRTLVDLRAEREKALASLEEIAAVDLAPAPGGGGR
ncbi:MAG TPA: TolC family protein [Planctomycetota bacterium]|jgi:outer membrane protein TolC|nr:TolC family protein [Planctomycetota bacterium]